jgi:hypothetical protein
MKKTSLVLAISALLYGTSSVYVLADDVVLSDFITETGGLIDSTVSLPEGFDDPQPLPLNVAVAKSDEPIILSERVKMCNPSFAVNGSAMAEFPVTVDGELGTWNGSTVTGTGWKLKLPPKDSWNSAWELTTDEGIVVTSILLEPFKRKNADQMKYVFDIGGKFPRFPAAREPYEHTPLSARGQFIIQRTPSEPKPIFTATYSYPVYTTYLPTPADPVGGHGLSTDSTNILLDDSSVDRVPTHDLYSTLEINFEEGVADLLFDPGFKFVADTDCLPVEAVAINSYKDGILDFTVAGDGAVAIIKDGEQTGLRFEVSRDIDGGIKNFQIPFDPQPGSCYYMRDENTGDEMTETYCAPN